LGDKPKQNQNETGISWEHSDDILYDGISWYMMMFLMGFLEANCLERNSTPWR
jgi:hypothetical protein